jgi:hypothetical protein
MAWHLFLCSNPVGNIPKPWSRTRCPYVFASALWLTSLWFSLDIGFELLPELLGQPAE